MPDGGIFVIEIMLYRVEQTGGLGKIVEGDFKS
jgi:hypothetical protein